MKTPHLTRQLAGLAGAAALFLACAASSHAQGLLYSATTLPAPAQSGAVHFMQLVTLPQGAGVYSLSAFSIGVSFNSNVAAAPGGNQGVEVFFYNGVDTSPTSTDAMANATMAGGVTPTTPMGQGLSGILASPGVAGNQTYFNFPIASPYLLTLTSSTVAVEFVLTDGSFTNYSDAVDGRFSATAPTTGGAASYVWNDADLDNTFTGAEQTKFGQTGAYVRFDLSGGLVPEPGTWAMTLVGGLGVVALAVRRRVA